MIRLLLLLSCLSCLSQTWAHAPPEDLRSQLSAEEEELVPNPLKVRLTHEQREHIRRVNQERKDNGLPPLAPAPSLMDSAQDHSNDMRDRNFFEHRPRNGKGYPDNVLPPTNKRCFKAENIAAGQKTVKGVMDRWMDSPGHKANILGKDYKYIGIGHASGGGTYGEYWTQNFSSEP